MPYFLVSRLKDITENIVFTILANTIHPFMNTFTKKEVDRFDKFLKTRLKIKREDELKYVYNKAYDTCPALYFFKWNFFGGIVPKCHFLNSTVKENFDSIRILKRTRNTWKEVKLLLVKATAKDTKFEFRYPTKPPILLYKNIFLYEFAKNYKMYLPAYYHRYHKRLWSFWLTSWKDMLQFIDEEALLHVKNLIDE